jgi:predicted DNA-binding antitoxin AbrB/MazE fold protein
MSETIEAVFDGKVFRPARPVALKPNSHVTITIETRVPETDGAPSFLKTARSLNLEGPADWSENLDKYLYGRDVQDEG